MIHSCKWMCCRYGGGGHGAGSNGFSPVPTPTPPSLNGCSLPEDDIIPKKGTVIHQGRIEKDHFVRGRNSDTLKGQEAQNIQITYNLSLQ